MASLPVIAAASLLELLGLVPPAQQVPPPPAKPAEALVASPSSGLKGTMLMVHGGGWLGPGPKAQQYLMEQPGDMLVKRGWRVVSVDYSAGTDGISDVTNAAGRELQRAEGSLLCMYGESAGAQISLIVASRVKSVDCVIAAGAPTDFNAYIAEADSSGDSSRRIIAGQMSNVFGSTEIDKAPWEPVKVADKITQDVLMLREADDRLMPREQLDRFVAARPTTESVELESTNAATPESWWLHGTLSDAGRAKYLATIGGFADRAYATRTIERAAKRTGCTGTTSVGTVVMTGALRCLARKDRTVSKRGKPTIGTTKRTLRGEVNAARAWGALRASAIGRRGLAALVAGRATVSLRRANPSTLTLRGRR